MPFHSTSPVVGDLPPHHKSPSVLLPLPELVGPHASPHRRSSSISVPPSSPAASEPGQEPLSLPPSPSAAIPVLLPVLSSDGSQQPVPPPLPPSGELGDASALHATSPHTVTPPPPASRLIHVGPSSSAEISPAQQSALAVAPHSAGGAASKSPGRTVNQRRLDEIQQKIAQERAILNTKFDELQALIAGSTGDKDEAVYLLEQLDKNRVALIVDLTSSEDGHFEKAENYLRSLLGKKSVILGPDLNEDPDRASRLLGRLMDTFRAPPLPLGVPTPRPLSSSSHPFGEKLIQGTNTKKYEQLSQSHRSLYLLDGTTIKEMSLHRNSEVTEVQSNIDQLNQFIADRNKQLTTSSNKEYLAKLRNEIEIDKKKIQQLNKQLTVLKEKIVEPLKKWLGYPSSGFFSKTASITSLWQTEGPRGDSKTLEALTIRMQREKKGSPQETDVLKNHLITADDAATAFLNIGPAPLAELSTDVEHNYANPTPLPHGALSGLIHQFTALAKPTSTNLHEPHITFLKEHSAHFLHSAHQLKLIQAQAYLQIGPDGLTAIMKTGEAFRREHIKYIEEVQDEDELKDEEKSRLKKLANDLKISLVPTIPAGAHPSSHSTGLPTQRF